MLLRISSSYFVAGIETYVMFGCYDYDLKLVPIHKTAPILAYMKGWPLHRIIHYCNRKGWQFEVVEQGRV